MYECIYLYIYIYIYIYIHTHTHIPSSSCRAASMDLPDPFSPPVSIVHCSGEVFKATSCIGTELLYVGSSWLSCLCLSMWRSPQEYVAYEFVLTSPAVSACLVHLTWIVFMGGRWPYSCCFVECCFQDLFKQLAAFLCNCRQTFSLYILLSSTWWIYNSINMTTA